MQEQDSPRTVEELQKTVEALDARVNDLALKSQITASRMIGRFGLDRFFGEDDFWDNIIDVSDGECHKRCIDDLQAEYAGIDANTSYTDADRAKARDEALKRATACHNNCDQRFPVPLGP